MVDKKYGAECMRRWRQRHQKQCPDCGKPINNYSKRCHSCHMKHNWKAGYFKNAPHVSREKHGRWKGGRTITDQGYIRILMHEHPRADSKGYVLEHILMWEKYHGKSLPTGYILHHLNGIKNDNRPQNLEALPNKKHYLLLQAKAKRIQELEALLNHQNQLL